MNTAFDVCDESRIQSPFKEISISSCRSPKYSQQFICTIRFTRILIQEGTAFLSLKYQEYSSEIFNKLNIVISVSIFLSTMSYIVKARC